MYLCPSLRSKLKYMYRHICLIFFLLVIVRFDLNSNSDINKEIISNQQVKAAVYEGFGYVYNFEFLKADSVLIQLKKNFNFSPWTYLFAANYYWWKIISGENSDGNINLFYSSLNTAKVRIGNSNTYEHQFLRIIIYSLLSRYDVMNGKYVQTLIELKKNLPIIKNTLGKEKEFHGFYLTSGLYLYLTDVVYNNYYYLRPLLLFVPSGDKEKGLEFLSKKHSDIVLDTESAYFLMKIYDEMEKKNKYTLHFAAKLANQYPLNYIFKEQYLRTLVRSRNNQLSQEELNAFKRQMLSNKQLSKAQTLYFNELAQKLKSVSS